MFLPLETRQSPTNIQPKHELWNLHLLSATNQLRDLGQVTDFL